ncbi:hypothetical protein DAPPUDRAFT_105366 [Daphnia pulex]|uniref:Uncharacterized protein n=1 Tax=Daphnia pulex TaxID=6669 RepID=E9GQJ3_DAPPU|nr:hypothetical protein DAPPUDRAFT_105366 [Daphnia pulex]|eukprot:EFX78124.1 hypothetical protein DAPPUDRAFT_105366 [Daphnia pulex]
MGKTQKQLAVSNAQPAPPKNGGVTKAKQIVLNKGLVNPRSILPIQRPILTVQQRLLAALRKVPYVPLQGPAKIKTLRITYTQRHILNLSLLSVHQFLCGKGEADANDTNIDLQVLLKVIKDKNRAGPIRFLPIAMSKASVDKVITIRNNTAHINLNKIEQTWTKDLPAMVLLNNSINRPDVATEIQRIVNEMMAGRFDGLVRFSFTFTAAFSFEKAIGLSMIVYGVILNFLAEPIQAFLQLKLNIPNITMDVYANTNYILDQIKKNNVYISPGGASRNDAQVLQTVFDCRNDNAHEAFTRSSADWKLQLDAVHDILDLIHHPNEASEVQAIVDRLVQLEAEGATVTQEDFKFFEQSYFGERRVSLARLEMVIIRPAGGSPFAKVEFAMKPKVTPTPKIWTYTLEVDYSERGQWSNWAMVIRPVGSTTRFNFPQVPKTDERRRSWKSKYEAVAFPAITEERRDDPSRICARIRQCVMDEKMDIPPVHLRTGTNFRLGSTGPKIIIHYCIGARAGPRGADPRVRSTVNIRIPKMISSLPPTCTLNDIGNVESTISHAFTSNENENHPQIDSIFSLRHKLKLATMPALQIGLLVWSSKCWPTRNQITGPSTRRHLGINSTNGMASNHPSDGFHLVASNFLDEFNPAPITRLNQTCPVSQ